MRDRALRLQGGSRSGARRWDSGRSEERHHGERPMLSRETWDQIHQCIKCGLCLAACPVYPEKLVEWASPRGKVQLARHILEGGLEITPRVREILSLCLLCGSCVAACPSGVHGDRLFSGLRWRAAQRYGLDWRKRVLFQLLGRRWMASGSAKLARWARGVLGPLVGGGVQIGGLPLKGVPPFNPRPFCKEAPEVVRPEGEVRARVLYFHGCATNYLYGEVGRSILEVLPHMGVEVRVPKDQGCCGLPIFLSGAREESLAVIGEVLQQFGQEDVDAVVVDCATCGAAFRNEYVPLLEELRDLGEPVEEDLVQAARRLASKTRDIMEFLDENAHWIPEGSEGLHRIRVTYHDPCHLLKGQGVGEGPRRVLRRLPQVELVEMEGADTCCGGGGSFQVEHPEVSLAITRRKVDRILATDAQVVATGCPGCRLTIGAHLADKGRIRVLHPIQIVHESLGGAQGL